MISHKATHYSIFTVMFTCPSWSSSWWSSVTVLFRPPFGVIHHRLFINASWWLDFFLGDGFKLAGQFSLRFNRPLWVVGGLLGLLFWLGLLLPQVLKMERTGDFFTWICQHENLHYYLSAFEVVNRKNKSIFLTEKPWISWS